jgi:mRNA interferase MazF
MKRGSVYWVDFEPAMGTEIKKLRPAVIVSNTLSNIILQRIQVVPLSSNTTEVYASETLIKLNGKTSKALIDQLTTVSVLRVGKKIAMLSAEDMFAIAKIIKKHLNLS